MTRNAFVVVAAALFGGVVVFFAQGQTASAEPSRVICTQIPQNPGSVDEQYIAKFMGDQLELGRVRFTTVNGVSTVMCAF